VTWYGLCRTLVWSVYTQSVRSGAGYLRQMPKIRWLKEGLPASYSRVGRLMDLTDWLTFKATGRVSMGDKLTARQNMVVSFSTG
jgi:sugar (pentulose or hexulose) kinase